MADVFDRAGGGGGVEESRVRCRGKIRLTAPFPTTLTVAGTYYPILGVWGDGLIHCFTAFANGDLRYDDPVTRVFLFNGVSNLKSDKLATINYTLYLNGAAVPGAPETQVTLNHANSYVNFAESDLVQLSQNDVLRVYAKSDVPSTTIDVFTLKTIYTET